MKVFLSSTFNDLIEHRKAAHDALEQLGLHVIGMESFGARPIESSKACLEEVAECELFVGIYAYRYGYIPDGKDISITEEEFNHAHKLGKPIFGFVVNGDHPWTPKYIEYDKKAKLDSFLSKVKKQPVAFFTSPDNLASSITPSVGRYLLVELQKKAQGEGKILFDKLKTYLDSTSKKRIEDDLSSFLVDIKQAALLAKKHGVESFSELIEFCLIRASLLTETRSLPPKYYVVKALLDGIEKTRENVENIGDPGGQSLAFAALASSELTNLKLKEEFSLRALDLSSKSGAEWEQSSNQSQIGNLLIKDTPTFGVQAFNLAIETIKKAKGISYIEPEIFHTLVEEFEEAYRSNSAALQDMLERFVDFVGSNGGYSLLLHLAKDLYKRNKSIALKILEKSYLELTSDVVKIKIPEHRKEEYTREIERNRKLLIETSLLLGEDRIAKDTVQTTKAEFDIKSFSAAVNNLNLMDFVQAIENCPSPIIKREAIIRLFEADKAKEAIRYLTVSDIEIANRYLVNIVENNLVEDLLKKVAEQKNENDIFSFFYERALVDLKISLAKEFYPINLGRSQELLSGLIVKNEAEPYKFPYWGDAALIVESVTKWDKSKTDELIKLCVDDFDEQISEADQLSKRSKSINMQASTEKGWKGAQSRLKEISAVMSLKNNNFVYALLSYEEARAVLSKRLNGDQKIRPEIESGKIFLRNEDWISFENWIKDFDFSDSEWHHSSELVDMVRDLVFRKKIDFAKKIASHLEHGTKWQADTWVEVFSALTELNAYDFEGFDEPSHIFLIRAKAVSIHSYDIANAYVNLYCEYIIKEKWLDDMLGWHLCDLALFLYEHHDKVNSYKYFLLGIQHWFQYAFETEETWNEIIEYIIKTDFELQFSLLQEVLLWNSARNIDDVVRTLQTFSPILVNNLQYEQIASILTAVKRSRDWHLKDETI